MARLKFFLILAVFFTQIFAAYEKELANFDKNFAASTQKEKYHNQLRSLYIQSSVNDDDESRAQILKRLIISAKALNLNANAYEDELKALNLKAENAKKSAEKTSENLAKNSSEKTAAAKNSSVNSSTNSAENSTKKPVNFVLSSTKNDSSVSLKMRENLSKSEVKISELKEKGNYRYIMDFEAALDGGRKEFIFGEIKIVLAQFDPKTTRLVINSKDEVKYNLEFKDKNFIVNLAGISKNQSVNSSKNSTPKTTNSTANSNKNSSKKAQKSKTLYILKATKDGSGIRLNLSDEIDEDDIRQFFMKDKGTYRIVANFEAALDGGRKNFSFGKDSASVLQYSPKIVRVVFNSQEPFELEKKVQGKSLYLGFLRDESTANLSTNSSKNSATNSSKKTTNSNANSNKKTTNSTANSSKNSAKNSSKKIIVIDAGHGGKDGGASNGSWIEKSIVLNVALKTGEELKKLGYKVFYTRTKDVYVNLRDRTQLANDKKANLFISIHANAAINKTKAKTSQGIETFFLSPARSERSKEVAAQENKADLEEANFFLKQNFLSALSREKIIASNRLAIDIQKHILSSVRKRYKVTDGGVREAPFWVLVGAQDMPAVLIEIGYISHSEEGKRLQNNAYQNLLAQGIAKGVANYFKNNADE